MGKDYETKNYTDEEEKAALIEWAEKELKQAKKEMREEILRSFLYGLLASITSAITVIIANSSR